MFAVDLLKDGLSPDNQEYFNLSSSAYSDTGSATPESGTPVTLRSPAEIKDVVIAEVLRLIEADTGIQTANSVPIDLQEKIREILIKQAIRDFIISNPLQRMSLHLRVDLRTYDRLRNFAVSSNVRLVSPEQRLLIELLSDFCKQVSDKGVVEYDDRILQAGDGPSKKAAVSAILLDVFKDRTRLQFLKDYTRVKTEVKYAEFLSTKTSDVPAVTTLAMDSPRELHLRFEQTITDAEALSKKVFEKSRDIVKSRNLAIDRYVDSSQFNKPTIAEIQLGPVQKFMTALWDW